MAAQLWKVVIVAVRLPQVVVALRLHHDVWVCENLPRVAVKHQVQKVCGHRRPWTPAGAQLSCCRDWARRAVPVVSSTRLRTQTFLPALEVPLNVGSTLEVAVGSPPQAAAG